jgi:hypothetical protein
MMSRRGGERERRELELFAFKFLGAPRAEPYAKFFS